MTMADHSMTGLSATGLSTMSGKNTSPAGNVIVISAQPRYPTNCWDRTWVQPHRSEHHRGKSSGESNWTPRGGQPTHTGMSPGSQQWTIPRHYRNRDRPEPTQGQEHSTMSESLELLNMLREAIKKGPLKEEQKNKPEST